MYDSPYTPHSPYVFTPYQIAEEEKHRLRRTSNRVCWTILSAIFTLLIIFAVLVRLFHSLGYFQLSITDSFQGLPPVLYYLLDSLGYIAMAVPPLIYFSMNHITLGQGLPFQKVSALKVAACVFFGCAVCLLGNIPANSVINIEKYFGFSGNLPQMPLSDDPLVIFLYAINIAVIPPLVEEMIFRGVVLQSLRRFGNGFAIFASALFFGLYHGNFVQFVFAFICGLVMGLIVVRTNSLLPTIIIHLLNNSFSIVEEMLEKYKGAAAANILDGYVFIIAIALGLIAFIYLIFKGDHFFRSENPPSNLKLSAKVGALFSNPGAIALGLYSLILSINILVKY